MNHETLRLARNILLRSFFVGVVIALFLGLCIMLGWNLWVPLASAWFHTDEATLSPAILQFFINIRFFLLFLLLTPGLALHWTYKKECNHCKDCSTKKK